MSYEFRVYQRSAADKLLQRRRAPLIAPMGSGKTLISLGAWNEYDVFRDGWGSLIVAPIRAHSRWMGDAEQFLDIPQKHIGQAVGDPYHRKWVWKNYKSFPFVITNYECLIRDLKAGWVPLDWAAVTGDEAHRLRNRKSVAYPAFAAVARRAHMVITASGTPFRRGPQDMWTQLNIADRNLFSSYWKFVNTWCVVNETHFGKEILCAKNVDNFKYWLKEMCAYVSDEEVAPYLPTRNRIIEKLRLDPNAQRMHDELDAEMMVENASGELIVTPTILSKITRLRQLLVCPAILDPSGDAGCGSGLSFAMDKIEEIEAEEGHTHAMIFTPFTAAIPHFEKALRARFPDSTVDVLQGGLTAAEVASRTARAKNSGGLVICSVQYAESFDMETCKYGFFIGYDWSADVNEQAEDRMRRLTSTHAAATFYYCTYPGTIDDVQRVVVDTKASNVRRITPRDFLRDQQK